jgi:nucleotide-binding universal stress UspA family protein
MREKTMVEFKHILCPIDFSDTSTRALIYAAAFATWYEAQLEVLHVVPHSRMAWRRRNPRGAVVLAGP